MVLAFTAEPVRVRSPASAVIRRVRLQRRADGRVAARRAVGRDERRGAGIVAAPAARTASRPASGSVTGAAGTPTAAAGAVAVPVAAPGAAGDVVVVLVAIVVRTAVPVAVAAAVSAAAAAAVAVAGVTPAAAVQEEIVVEVHNCNRGYQNEIGLLAVGSYRVKARVYERRTQSSELEIRNGVVSPSQYRFSFIEDGSR